MKIFSYCTVFVFLVIALLWPCQQVQAQTADDTTNVIVGDTMYVACFKTNYDIRVNALRDAINGDTVLGGGRADLNRVYKLKLDGLYYLVDPVTNSGFSLEIVGDPMENIGSGHYPPLIQMLGLRPPPDGTAGSGIILQAGGDVTLRNIWITGKNADNGNQTAYQPVQFNANNRRYIIDGCVFEQSNFSLVVFGGTGCVGYVINNKFRNLEEAPPTQQWTGRGISIWADQDSIIIENNSFFNLGFATFQMEGGSAKYLRYNHNTIVNTGRGLMSNSGNWWQNAYFANNLIINSWWEGEGYGDTHGSNRDARQFNSGFFAVAPLPAAYGTEETRRVVIHRNYAYTDPSIVAKWGDSIARAYFTDDVSKADFLVPYTVGGPAGGHMFVGDTVWLSSLPIGFTNYLADANWQQPKYPVTGATMVDSMWAFITQVRQGSGIYTTFFYHPVVNAFDTQWPLPENLGYSNTDPLFSLGTDGLPIGDLNYFPAQKAIFYANQATFAAQLDGFAGNIVVDSVKSTVECEDGAIGGTSVIDAFSGFSYFAMESGGSIQWTFNLATGGVYGMNVWSNLRNQGMRGENFLINGEAIHDVIGWGELEFRSSINSAEWMPARGVGINIPDDRWQWYFYPVDSILAADQAKFVFLAGQNTIRITPSWGYQDFAGIDLIASGVTPPTPGGTVTGGDLIIALRAPDAVTTIVTPHGEGAPWIPSMFKSVILGSAGTDTVTVTAGVAGTYKLRLFGLNYNTSAQPITVTEGGLPLGTINLPRLKTDTTGVDGSSPLFSLSAGEHTLVLSGGGAAQPVKMDFVQLIKEDIINDVDGSGIIPNVFSLAQNYPNPFNPSTTIRFTIGKATNVKLTVFNILGQKIATLVDGFMNAGPQSIVFDAGKLASGVYFYRLDAGSNFHSVKKMLLLK